MIFLRIFFADLEAALLDKQRRATEDERRGADERRWATDQLRLLRKNKVAAGALIGGVRGVVISPESGGAEEPVGVVRPSGRWIPDVGAEVPLFFPAENDEETNEPVYDVRVVSGKKSNRQRVDAAARVYGYELREVSLATAIFATGETKAASPASVRASLGGLVRYGHEWARDRGWLVYQGEALRPDQEMILMLVNERWPKASHGDVVTQLP